MSSTINWLLALALVALLACVGPTIDDHSTEWAQAQDLTDAINAEAARRQLAKKIVQKCGDNAAWLELGDGLYQCQDKHGRKTLIAQVQP
jgi:hypothetical protein